MRWLYQYNGQFIFGKYLLFPVKYDNIIMNIEIYHGLA